MVEGVVGGGLRVEVLLALGRAEVVAGGICPWVVVGVGVVGHDGGAGGCGMEDIWFFWCYPGQILCVVVACKVAGDEFSFLVECVCLVMCLRGEVVDFSSCLRHTTSDVR